MSLQPGQMLAHFRLEEKIGQGGMGEVYAAEDTRLKRRVAVNARSSSTSPSRSPTASAPLTKEG